MTPIGFHVNFGLRDRRVISPDVPSHRRAALGVCRAARPFQLLAFRIADTHVHVQIMEDETASAEAVRRIKLALHRALDLPVPFATAHYEPITSQSHVDSAFRYVLRQSGRHGFGHDPYADASNLPDLLGLRVAGTWTASNVRRWLPRLGRPTLLAALGVDQIDETPVPVDDLVDATLAATAQADLVGRRPKVVAARCAAVHAVDPQRSTNHLANMLGITTRSVQHQRRRDPDPLLVRAIRLQADLRRRKPIDARPEYAAPVSAAAADAQTTAEDDWPASLA